MRGIVKKIDARYVVSFARLRMYGFEFNPHRPYQLSHSLQRTCQFREAAKGSNKREDRRPAAHESCGTDGKPTNYPRTGAFPNCSQGVGMNPCSGTSCLCTNCRLASETRRKLPEHRPTSG